MGKQSAIRIKTTVEGADEIIRALKHVGAEADAILNDAVLAAAEPIRAEAERRAPRLTGGGAASIEKKIVDKGKGKARAVVGPDVAQPKRIGRGGQKHFYMLIQEFGADAHTISPKNKKALAFDGVIVAGAQHPGLTAQPFMRPAWDTKRDEAEEAAADVLRKKLRL
jgi:HK97 gp10 family phage protein